MSRPHSLPSTGSPLSILALVAAVVGSLIIWGAGCTPKPHVEPSSEPEGSTSEPLPPGIFVVISKNERTLTVYRDGQLVVRYTVVFGRHPRGRKRFEGDMRTPEGLYHVVEKRRHSRWRYFISLDYPNDQDRAAYRHDVHEGLIPSIDHRRLPIGGGIGIHGNDRPEAQESGVDWTKGCVAMRNDDIDELVSLVGPGTPVLIEP